MISEDVINFCRCDYIAVMRFKDGIVNNDEIFQAINTAIQLVGKRYDFEFESNDDEFYCTELVKEIWKHKSEQLTDCEPIEVKILKGLIKKRSILPDQFWHAKSLRPVFVTEKVENNYTD